jgi:hypothetical protein
LHQIKGAGCIVEEPQYAAVMPRTQAADYFFLLFQ